MPDLRRHLTAIALAAVGLVVLALLFTSALFALALVAPVVGLLLGWLRVKGALSLWRSGGRFPVGDAVQIIEPSRARGLGLAELASAAGTVAASTVPALWLFESLGAAIAAGVGSVVVLGAASAARRRLLAGASPVEVLPPEERDPFGR